MRYMAWHALDMLWEAAQFSVFQRCANCVVMLNLYMQLVCYMLQGAYVDDAHFILQRVLGLHLAQQAALAGTVDPRNAF